MRRRVLVVLGAAAVLGIYTGLKAAIAFPAHPLVAAAGAALALALFVAWQIAYRAGRLPDGGVWARAFAWAASAAVAVWATFLILSALGDAAHPILLAFSRADADAAPAAVAASALLIAALGLERALAGPRVKEVRVRARGLAAGLRGLRIVQISDLHAGPTIRREAVARVVERVMALSPDLIAVTGDLADGDARRLAAQVEPLSGLRAPLGVYYVPGNHEYYWNAPAWIEKARALGFTPLINESCVVERAGARLLVAGVPDESGAAFVPGHEPDHAKAVGRESADFRLLLAHRPDGAAAASRAGFDLQLSGHTHGGQFFPASLFIGFFHKHARGLSREADLTLYVNSGTGYWGPAHRFAVPAEITLLVLEGEETA